jgi:hypothetical protein
VTTLSPAKMLLVAVTAYLDEHYSLWRLNEARLPAGLRVEMHPYVRYLIIRDEEARYWPADDLKTVFGLPVKVTPDLPDGTWRLVIVTEDVLAGGKL